VEIRRVDAFWLTDMESHLWRFTALVLSALSVLAPILAEGGSAKAQQAAPERNKLRDIALGPFQLGISGELRLRDEYQSGFDVRGYRPGESDNYLLSRIMLGLDLKLDENRHAYLQFRDARAFGSSLGREDFKRSNPLEDIWDVRQGYFEWRRIGGSPLEVKAGRQQISYGDQRVFGPGLWGNTGRYAWDAAKLRFDTAGAWFDVWAGRPIENRPERWPNRPFSAPTAFVAYGSPKRLPLRLDLFYAGKFDGRGSTEGESGEGNLESHSVGFQLQGQVRESLDYTATAIRQFGHYGQDTIAAFGVNGALGLTLPMGWSPRVCGQFTWGSGDRDPADGRHGTFDGVFGGADINFYGDLNLFYWANLRDYEWDLHLRPVKSVRLALEHHFYTLDQARDAWYSTGLAAVRRDPTGLTGKTLGHELNLRLTWQPRKGIELMPGWGRFFPGRYARANGAGKAATGYFFQSSFALN
jgi:hypothetical protein